MKFSYHHQNIVTLLSGVTVASELLLRTQPAPLMPALISSKHEMLTHTVALTEAKVRYAKYMLDSGEARTIFLNYSPWQVESDSFLSCLDELDVLMDMGALIIIEITENSLCDSIDALERNASIARDRGYFIAVDDFGSGESNFNALFKLQPSIVKLDSSIIRDASNDPRAKEGFYQLTELLRNLGFRIVIEGIETSNQLTIARHAQADFAQGYYFHHPEPIMVEPEAQRSVVTPITNAIPAV